MFEPNDWILLGLCLKRNLLKRSLDSWISLKFVDQKGSCSLTRHPCSRCLFLELSKVSATKDESLESTCDLEVSWRWHSIADTLGALDVWDLGAMSDDVSWHSSVQIWNLTSIIIARVSRSQVPTVNPPVNSPFSRKSLPLLLIFAHCLRETAKNSRSAQRLFIGSVLQPLSLEQVDSPRCLGFK